MRNGAVGIYGVDHGESDLRPKLGRVLQATESFHQSAQRSRNSNPMKKPPLGPGSQYTTQAPARNWFANPAIRSRSPDCQRHLVNTRAPRGLTFSVTICSVARRPSASRRYAATAIDIRFSLLPYRRIVTLGLAVFSSDFRGIEFFFTSGSNQFAIGSASVHTWPCPQGP